MIFIIAALLLLLPDCYILFAVMNKASWWWKGLFLLPTAAYFCVLIRIFFASDMRQGMLNMLFWLTLCIVFPILIFTIVSLIGKGVGLAWHAAGTVFNIIGIVSAGIWLGMSVYGIAAGWKRVTVENVEIISDRLPAAFDGYRIVQLSDFHIGTYSLSPGTVEKIVEEVNALNPDLILFTGDLVNVSPNEVEEFVGILKRLKARDGIYSVLGNHDYCLYRDYKLPDTPEKELAKLTAVEKEIGWRLLRNESVEIVKGNDSIAIVGVENAGSRSFIDRSDLPAAVKGLPKDEYKILLSHDPTHWRREVLPKSDIDLMLAGHTHAMQFKLFGWSPSEWTYPEWGGLYEEGRRKLYVSTGIGENIAFRFGAWPQIVSITLKR
ncbi:MAG: metallophosphoesterase [Muribaculaceae bacterium]|nr:metallophosphoesterase [Muribaculaceae bacterium]MDE6755502.1 metallophosphoesterase [Muribaculaceae bacterium]